MEQTCAKCGFKNPGHLKHCIKCQTVLGNLAKGRLLAKRYRIDSLLGKGNMGYVFRAFDTNLERYVALKAILFADIISPEQRERAKKRLLIEAKAQARLGQHPNIVTVYDTGFDVDVQYIVMEMIDGNDLTQYLSQNIQFPVKRVLHIVRDICSALAFAHQNNVIHRDIKPSNIMLTQAGITKVADFGIAKILDPDESNITKTGMLVGTPNYMSPEQVLGKPLDGRSDIFSLGCIFYKLLAMKSPFPGDNIIQVMEAILNQKPAPLYRLNSEVTENINTIVTKCLEKERQNRYQSAKALHEDLTSQLTAPVPPTVKEQEKTLTRMVSRTETPAQSKASSQPAVLASNHVPAIPPDDGGDADVVTSVFESSVKEKDTLLELEQEGAIPKASQMSPFFKSIILLLALAVVGLAGYIVHQHFFREKTAAITQNKADKPAVTQKKNQRQTVKAKPKSKPAAKQTDKKTTDKPTIDTEATAKQPDERSADRTKTDAETEKASSTEQPSLVTDGQEDDEPQSIITPNDLEATDQTVETDFAKIADFFQQGLFKEAVMLYEEQPGKLNDLATSALQAEYAYMVGMSYYALKNHAQALPLLRQAVEHTGKAFPYYSQAMKTIAEMEQESGDYEQAADHYLDALSTSDPALRKQIADDLFFLIDRISNDTRKQALLIAASKHLGADQAKKLANSFFELGEIHYNRNDFRQAVSYYEQAIQAAQNLQDIQIKQRYTAQFQYRIGFCYIKLEQNDNALGYLRDSLEYYRNQEPDSELYGNLLNTIGTISNSKQEKISYLKEAMRFYSAQGNEDRYAEACLEYGKHMIDSNTPSKAYALLSGINPRRLKNNATKASIYFYLAEAAEQMKRMDEAIEHFKDAMLYYNRSGNTERIGIVQFRLSQLYAKQKDYNQSLRLVQEAKTTFEDVQEPYWDAHLLYQEAYIYVQLNRISQAKNTIAQGLSLIENLIRSGHAKQAHLQRLKGSFKKLKASLL